LNLKFLAMEKINFNTNLNNKLAGKYFTTIRLKNTHKFHYEETYKIYLKKGKESKFLFLATLIDMREIKLNDINEFIAGLDTGYSSYECRNMIKTMYKKYDINWDVQLLSFILFKKEVSKTHQLISEQHEVSER